MSAVLFRAAPAIRANSARHITTAAAASTGAAGAGAAAAALSVAKVSAKHQAILAFGSIGAWGVMMAGAPYWVPRTGEKIFNFRERVSERLARMPKMRLPAGVRIPIPRVGSVQL